MVNTKLLENEIVNSGKKKGFLATRCGLSRQGFLLKCNNKQEFTAAEIMVLCDELKITQLTKKDAIFFAREVE